MLTISSNCTANIFRWDIIARFGFTNSYTVSQLKTATIRMHEIRPQNYKDRFVFALLLETLGMQRLSNKIIIKNRYKKSLTVKHTSSELTVQLTLRKHSLSHFTDKFFFYTLPQSNTLSQYKNLQISKNGELSFYCDELKFFPGLGRLSTVVYEMPSIQIHLSGKYLHPSTTHYILSSYRIPTESEGTIFNKTMASYNFFNKY